MCQHISEVRSLYPLFSNPNHRTKFRLILIDPYQIYSRHWPHKYPSPVKKQLHWRAQQHHLDVVESVFPPCESEVMLLRRISNWTSRRHGDSAESHIKEPFWGVLAFRARVCRCLFSCSKDCNCCSYSVRGSIILTVQILIRIRDPFEK